MQISLSFFIEREGNAQDVKLKIKRIGRESCKPDKKDVAWTGSHYSLHFIREGKGSLKIGDDETPLKEGMCFVLYKDTPYEYYPDKSHPWKYDWIDFSGENVELLLSECGFSQEKPYRSYRTDKYFLGELNRLYEIHDVRPYNHICVAAQFFKLLSELIYRNKETKSQPKTVTARFFRVRDCIVYINCNFRLDLTLADIAKANSISVSYLTSSWSKEIGMSPIEYMHAMRISEACRYLKNSTQKIKDIAQNVGYTDEKYFSRVFKKHKGVTPVQYRKFSEEPDPFLWLKEKNIDFR